MANYGKVKAPTKGYSKGTPTRSSKVSTAIGKQTKKKYKAGTKLKSTKSKSWTTSAGKGEVGRKVYTPPPRGSRRGTPGTWSRVAARKKAYTGKATNAAKAGYDTLYERGKMLKSTGLPHAKSLKAYTNAKKATSKAKKGKRKGRYNLKQWDAQLKQYVYFTGLTEGQLNKLYKKIYG
ncbi:hypothetical protein CMI37_05800 [Candidatus Pacearchaeota archaeon]|nr:hypothetical protein [Candidatus Pacearchaeota archaeon]